MKTAQGAVPGYNAQDMVSPLAGGEGVPGMLITAVDAVDEVNDLARLTPMVEQERGGYRGKGSDDPGQRGLFCRQAPGGMRPERAAGGDARSEEEAKTVYRLRKQLAEPVFEIIKEQQRARRLLLRGLANVSDEWAAVTTASPISTPPNKATCPASIPPAPGFWDRLWK